MTLPRDTTILLQDQQGARPRWLRFGRPLEVIRCDTPAGVMQCLQRIEERVDSGLYAAGFISYEASSGFDGVLRTHAATGVPCLWFGIFERYEEVELPLVRDAGPFHLEEWAPSVSWQQYHRAIEKIKHHIREGDTYQVNYTFRLRSRFDGDPLRFFCHLYQAQRSSYSAYVDIGKYRICSVSPEIFLSLDGSRLMCKPMKGTLRRGYTDEQDYEAARWLHASPKDRAENVMIVDMIRNDMGRIAETGSVEVSRLFEIEKYPTVHQMTSTVRSTTSASIAEILRTTFPCASITGAPKVKTMEIIRDVEPDPREIYTGSIGYIAPGRRMQFNVAIRTVQLEMETGTAMYGVGGGITWYSDTHSEYEECRAKASVLTYASPEFELLESLAWDPATGYYLLDEHLRRLEQSCRYFDFPFSQPAINEKLARLEQGFGGRRQKVRLLLARDGAISLQAAPVNSMLGWRVGISPEPINTGTPFVHHKTTYRDAYERPLKASTEFDDLVFWNKDGFITETAIANVVVDMGDGRLVTPPVHCGLLAGVMRSCLLKEAIIHEEMISGEQLRSARNVYLINSVRGWMRLAKHAADSWVVVEEHLYNWLPQRQRAGEEHSASLA